MHKRYLNGRTLSNLIFADCVCMLGRTAKELQELTTKQSTITCHGNEHSEEKGHGERRPRTDKSIIKFKKST